MDVIDPVRPATVRPRDVQSTPAQTIAPAPLDSWAVRTAVVVIGRNEGDRLRRCLEAAVPHVQTVVYVDSGSSDGSIDMAQSLGVAAVPLDMSVPFTAARARNVGFAAAVKLDPDIELVQFLDGDTEVERGWIARAARFMADHPDAAAVFGRRRERHPEASIYNQLCDVEWSVPPGEAKYCGGDVMIRRAAFEGVSGYTDRLIAGEEPDLCLRLRRNRWTIHCIEAEMTLHDASMVAFGQWWRRTKRSGFAFAQGAHMHGAAQERHWVKEAVRIWIWALLIPLAAIVPALLLSPHFLWILAIYPIQVTRVYFKYPGSSKVRFARAFFYTLARFPEMIGAGRFYLLRLLGRPATIIEYK